MKCLFFSSDFNRDHSVLASFYQNFKIVNVTKIHPIGAAVLHENKHSEDKFYVLFFFTFV